MTFFLFANIIRMVRSRRMRWARYVALMGETMNAYTKARRKETTRNEKTQVG
jgi:hypothetical protein